MTVVEDGKADFIQRGAMATGAGTPAVGERLVSALNTAQAGGDL